MPRLKLTQAVVDKLAWASAVEKWREEDPKERRGKTPQRVEIWDTHLPEFGLMIRPSGRKTWQALYRVDRKPVRETFGTSDKQPSLAAAREAARLSMAKARAGQNPVAEKREAKAEEKCLGEEEAKRAAATLGALLKTYITERPKVNKRGRPLAAEYLAEIKRAIERDIVHHEIGKRPISQIGQKDISALLYDMAKSRPSHARHLHAYLRAAFDWLRIHKDDVPNLMAGIEPPAPKTERDRTLTEDYEVRLFWHACDEIGWPFGPLFQLLCLLGPRRDELACATWREFKLTEQVWELPDSKNDEPQITHLPRLAVEILESLPRMASEKGYVFTTQRRGNDTPVSGFSDAWGRVEKIMQQSAAEEGLPQIEHFTRHDLRRTIAYGMAKLGVAPHVADKILNHTGGSTITGVMRVYNRFQYLAERKDALDKWAKHIEDLVGITRQSVEPARNVVELAAARG
jgi:integrase